MTSELSILSNHAEHPKGSSAYYTLPPFTKLALGKNKEVLDAELWGVSEALGVALRETALRKPYKVIVFSDSQMAIRKL